MTLASEAYPSTITHTRKSFESSYTLLKDLISFITAILSVSRNLANYMQPLVIVKVNAPMGVDVNMICNAWAGGINNDEKGGYGSVKFTMRIN